ncbi:hypothetical protein E2C01_066601 [Portunus trituberculatus]|uniref:Uncharacterized protein n=1 Tax=Portunus trituberculatus TaxID=210409 RepID=A0A5B7HHJ4_PORTR|nr:hypothetical protein [Portunus trituberculatus]
MDIKEKTRRILEIKKSLQYAPYAKSVLTGMLQDSHSPPLITMRPAPATHCRSFTLTLHLFHTFPFLVSAEADVSGCVLVLCCVLWLVFTQCYIFPMLNMLSDFVM